MEATSLITNSDNANVFIASFDKVFPRLQAMPAEALKQINYDIPWATTAVLGSLPEILQLRDKAAQLPFFKINVIDDLKDVTLALSHANALYQSACEPSDALKLHNEQALVWRDKLHAVVGSLAACGYLTADALKRTSGLSGYRNVATDIQILTSVLNASWRQVENKCPISRADLDTAANLAATILTTYGVREQGPASVEATADIRTRASTLFWECWSETRRAVTFLRWGKGDADTIAPPIFAPRKRTTEPEPQEPAEPAVTDVNPNPGGSPFNE